MMRAILAGFTVVFAAVLLATNSSTAAAQTCGFCSDNWDEDDGFYHDFGNSGALFSCEEGDGCHTGDRLKTCGDEHSTCFESEELVEETVAAAWSASPAALEVALKKYARSVVYDAEGRVLRFRDCTGRYVGAVVIPKRVKVGT